MNIRLTLILFLFIVTNANAEGWGDLQGKNSNGDIVDVYPAQIEDFTRDYSLPENHNLFFVNVYKQGKGTIAERTTNYRDQRCWYKIDSLGKLVELYCENSGKSPLSGARYKIVPNKNENDCSHEAKYICIGGCDKSITPKELTKSYWECGE